MFFSDAEVIKTTNKGHHKRLSCLRIRVVAVARIGGRWSLEGGTSA